MDKVFGSLKGLVKPQSIVIDNNVFRLHYKATVIALVAFSILVTSRQYFGDPINCISKDDFPSKLLDTYCWIHTTFSVEQAWNKKVGVEVPYPGVDNYRPGEKRVFHAYYQWVCFVLFLQAILFTVPRYLWKMWEGGKVRSLVLELNSPILTSEKRADRRGILVEYFINTVGNHNVLLAQYIFCEVLNFVNVVGQMYLIDTFLGGEFSSYGTKVVRFTEWDWSVRFDPMIKVFPRLTKCTFHRYGSSGDVQKHDAMCILPINIINEKIYIFVWFWFVVLAILSGLVLVYRIAVLVSSRLRTIIIKSRSRLAKEEDLETVLNKCQIGEWFLLDLLCKNFDAVNYRDFIADFSRRLSGKDSSIV